MIGSWIRTASPRGLLSCHFDEDGSYAFAIAGETAIERGSYRLEARPSELDPSGEILALVLRTQSGDESHIVVNLRGDDMLLDGQRWRRRG